MKVVILAGGRGTRLGGDQPKPMVEIGGIPMLSHIMGIYRKYGHNEFVIATGYKGEMIRDYYKMDDSVTCLDTGLDTGTGERVERCYDLIGEPFLMTYGDGLADINIKKLLTHHRSNAPCVTVTAVRPPARFGQIVIAKDGYVEKFNEKPENQREWINGGFFVVNDLIPDFDISWEFDVMPRLAEADQLLAYKHTGFWHCMDTQRDVDALNQLWKDGAPWL